MILFSDKSKKLPQSPIRKLVPLAQSAKSRGIKVFHLNIGDPDIKTPTVMIKALKSWDREIISYENSQGNAELLTSLAWYYQKLGYKGITEKNIQITLGGSEGLLWIFLTIADPGDDILVFEPFYANYNSFAVMSGVKLVPVTTKIDNGFHLPISSIQEKITSRTRGILICNPNNPTGTLYTKDELQQLYDLCRQNNLWLVSDEVYREFVYDGKKQTSILEIEQNSLGQEESNVVLCDSLSKRYSLCGARLGCLVSRNDEFMSSVLKLAQARLSAPLIEQIIASKMKEVNEEYLRNVNKEYQARRDFVCQQLAGIKGVIFTKPEGAFYIIVKLPVDSAENFCKWLLTDFEDNRETIMLAPAAGFYATAGLGLNEIRIAYVLNLDDLKQAMKLLKKALTRYNSN